MEDETLPQKNEAAVALGKLRWANKSDADKKKHTKMMALASAKARRKDEGIEIVYKS